MSDLEPIEPHYAKRAQEFIDLLVDKGFMRDDVSREETRVLEEYVGFLFQSNAKMIERTADLMRKYKSDAKL